MYYKNECINWAEFLHADVNWGKLQITLTIFWVVALKNGSETLIYEGIDEFTWFFCMLIYIQES